MLSLNGSRRKLEDEIISTCSVWSVKYGVSDTDIYTQSEGSDLST